MLEWLSFEREMQDLGLRRFEAIQYEVVLGTPPTNRSSSDYIRWVQNALNLVMRLGLTVDGKMGPQTKSAIKRFQQQQRLVADGIFGPKTEAAIRIVLSKRIETPIRLPPGGEGEQLWILDHFEFAKATLTNAHKGEIRAISEFIKTRQGTPNQVRYIDIIGHTDPVGSIADNYRLGCLRAWAVAKQLKQDLGWPLNTKFAFRIASLGEMRPVPPGCGDARKVPGNNVQPVPCDDASSRRVEVSLYSTKPGALPNEAKRCDLPGSKKKPPDKTPPDKTPPDKTPPDKRKQCDWEREVDWDEKFARNFDTCCADFHRQRTLCDWARGIPEICRLTPQQFEDRVDACVHGNVFTEVVAETGIVGGIGECQPAAIVAKRYAEWKGNRKCW
jgi:outer membrane protein OmpA-like peptidoglycan-associated protein